MLVLPRGREANIETGPDRGPNRSDLSRHLSLLSSVLQWFIPPECEVSPANFEKAHGAVARFAQNVARL
jgi:hypothetical protein